MYICICKAVNEQKLHEAVTKRGVTAREACEILGAGSDCGSCKRDVEQKCQDIDNKTIYHTKVDYHPKKKFSV
jgi:bacterioferritin-associated ferredoxin